MEMYDIPATSFSAKLQAITLYECTAAKLSTLTLDGLKHCQDTWLDWSERCLLSLQQTLMLLVAFKIILTCLQVAQEKADQLTGLLQDELAKRGKPSVTPWQQQRLQLRAVRGPSGSPAARVGSPSNFRYTDASVDSLQQQRAKLKPVQTSKLAALPAPVQQEPGAAPTLAPPGVAQLKGVQASTAIALPAAVSGVLVQPLLPSEARLTACLSSIR